MPSVTESVPGRVYVKLVGILNDGCHGVVGGVRIGDHHGARVFCGIIVDFDDFRQARSACHEVGDGEHIAYGCGAEVKFGEIAFDRHVGGASDGAEGLVVLYLFGVLNGKDSAVSGGGHRRAAERFLHGFELDVRGVKVCLRHIDRDLLLVDRLLLLGFGEECPAG